MNYRRTALKADVQKYELNKGLEDGFEPWADVIVDEWIATDPLVKITRDDGIIVCPYISTRRGKVFIEENDYIIKDEDGTRHVCGADKIWNRYEQIQ